MVIIKKKAAQARTLCDLKRLPNQSLERNRYEKS